MSENFDKNINEILGNGDNGAQPSPDEAENVTQTSSAPKEDTQPVYTPPVTNPGAAYTPPVYGNSQYYAQGGQSNPYAPYGAYQPQPRPEAEKKPSKGKKKGLIIAVIVLCAIFLVSVAVVACTVIFGAFGNKEENNDSTNDKAQMELVNPPAASDNTEKKDGGKLTAGEVYAKVYESSVGVLVYTSNQQQLYSEGTGIVAKIEGGDNGTYIVTCAHVINVSNPRVVVQLHDGTQYEATVVGLDSKTDIGLLRVSESNFKTAEFASSDTVKVGDTVYAIGNPGGTQFFGSFTDGMISAIGRPVNSPVGYEVECIQHTAPINPGNSGGALVNEYGQIIGINSSKIASTDYEGMGFSVPSSTVKEIVDELVKNGRVTNRPALGISFIPSSYSRTHSIILRSNGLPTGAIIIDTIYHNSDLNNHDVKSGDMILAVNGKDLETYETLLDIIEERKVGDTITLKIGRIDSNYQVSTFDITVKLVEDTYNPTTQKESETQNNQFPFGNYSK